MGAGHRSDDHEADRIDDADPRRRIPGPGGPDEDRSGGFERGGWTAPFADKEGWKYIVSLFERADALLLGRRTWEIFEGYWPHHDGGDPVSHGINILPKYVPSTTLKDPTWQNMRSRLICASFSHPFRSVASRRRWRTGRRRTASRFRRATS